MKNKMLKKAGFPKNSYKALFSRFFLSEKNEIVKIQKFELFAEFIGDLMIIKKSTFFYLIQKIQKLMEIEKLENNNL